jgi:hypothetical protein
MVLYLQITLRKAMKAMPVFGVNYLPEMLVDVNF